LAKTPKLLSQSKKHYTNEEKEQKQNVENAMDDLQPIQKSPPNWLSKTAKTEYNRIYPLLQELPIKSLDLAMVSTYCQAYADYQEANRMLSKTDTVEYTERGSKLSPWHTVKRDSFNIMNSIAPKLGLTIDGRLKILPPKKEEKPEDEFGEMLND
jgi:P27 family predicted phage terminase small subunit